MSNGISDYVSWGIEDGEIDPEQPFKCNAWANGKTYEVTMTFKEIEE